MPIERALGRVIIQSLVGKGLSQRGIARAVRSAGHGYRTELLNDDIRKFEGRFKNEFYIRKLNVNEVVPNYLMVDTELKMPRKYQVFGTQTKYDPFTDSYTFETGSMYTDDLSKIGDWEDEFMYRWGDKCPAPKPELQMFKVTGVEHNKGWGY